MCFLAKNCNWQSKMQLNQTIFNKRNKKPSIFFSYMYLPFEQCKTRKKWGSTEDHLCHFFSFGRFLYKDFPNFLVKYQTLQKQLCTVILHQNSVKVGCFFLTSKLVLKGGSVSIYCNCKLKLCFLFSYFLPEKCINDTL